MDDSDTCVICGNYVPEGAMICYICEHREYQPFPKIQIHVTKGGKE